MHRGHLGCCGDCERAWRRRGKPSRDGVADLCSCGLEANHRVGISRRLRLLGIGGHSSSRQRSPSVPNDCARESSRESTLGTAKRDRLCTYSSGHL